MSDNEELRQALRARLETCWDRLDDAASELMELHGVSVDAIVARFERLAPGETEAGEPHGMT